MLGTMVRTMMAAWGSQFVCLRSREAGVESVSCNLAGIWQGKGRVWGGLEWLISLSYFGGVSPMTVLYTIDFNVTVCLIT